MQWLQVRSQRCIWPGAGVANVSPRRVPVQEILCHAAELPDSWNETIAILEALIKWEDKLLGRKFVIVTDHKSLEYFETQPSLSSQQTRWWEYLSHFNFTVQHVDGMTNWVVDCLSHYYKTDGPEDKHPGHEFMSPDTWLDPDRELLPVQRYIEVCAAAPDTHITWLKTWTTCARERSDE